MIMISGTLKTSTQSAQAVLQCELGIFSILDERLESVSPGDYEGLFEIESIKPQLLPSSDSTVQLGIVASLNRFSFLIIQKTLKSPIKKERQTLVDQPQLSLFVESEEISESSTKKIEWNATSDDDLAMPDSTSDSMKNILETPVETDNAFIEATAPMKTELAQVDNTSGITAIFTALALTASDFALFGENFVLSETIKLDTTEPREKLCQQRDRLKQFGYRFDVIQQIWQRPDHSSKTPGEMSS
jgi:Protein of unknown function (DUF3275)